MISIIIIAVLIALLRGGRFPNLGRISIHFPLFIVLGLGIDLLIFSSWWPPVWEGLVGYFFIASLAILLSVAVFNLRLPGFKLLAVGLLSNSLVIAANEGAMPISLDAVRQAQYPDVLQALETQGRYRHSIVMTEETTLFFLGDVFGLNHPFPAPRVFSIGDVLVASGAFWFVQQAMLGRIPPRGAAGGLLPP